MKDLIFKRPIRTITYSFIVILSLSVLTGCGSTTKIKGDTLAALEQIEELEYELALETLDGAEEKGEDARQIARARGIANFGLTNYEEARDYFLETLTYSDWRVDDVDFDVNYYLADTYERLGDYEMATETLSAILGLKEKDMLAHYKRGADYLLIGKYDEAQADFARALEIAPDDYDLRIEVAGRLSENGYDEIGRQYLEDFLEEKEKRLSDFEKGRIYFYMNEYELAKSYFEEARDDDDQSTVLFLGKTYEMLGDFNYATSTYQNYLTKHPEAAFIYNQLGLARIQSGDFEGAREAFSTAKNLGNTGIEQTLAFNEMVASEYTGNFEQAKGLIVSYLKKYPDDEDAVREQIFLSTR